MITKLERCQTKLCCGSEHVRQYNKALVFIGELPTTLYEKESNHFTPNSSSIFQLKIINIYFIELTQKWWIVVPTWVGGWTYVTLLDQHINTIFCRFARRICFQYFKVDDCDTPITISFFEWAISLAYIYYFSKWLIIKIVGTMVHTIKFYGINLWFNTCIFLWYF